MDILLKRRMHVFSSNKRAKYSFILFVFVALVCLFAPIIANDKPLVLSYKNQLYFPLLHAYPETTFGGDFHSEPDYKDPYIQELIQQHGWLIFPPIPYSYNTVIFDLDAPAPTPPSLKNILGTDDQGRDILARLIYGYAISLAFGIILTVLSSIIGIIAGALMGYYGGMFDLYAQRFIEIYTAMPALFLVMIFSSIIEPSFWWLLLFILLFSWVVLVSAVRAEFLRARNLDYVRSSQALGADNIYIIFKHILPNVMPIVLSFLPFILSSSITLLTSLDFLGFGLPVGSPSLGEILVQAKNNLYAPWIGICAFVSIAFLLSILVFIGEGLRDAFDPRHIKFNRHLN